MLSMLMWYLQMKDTATYTVVDIVPSISWLDKSEGNKAGHGNFDMQTGSATCYNRIWCSWPCIFRLKLASHTLSSTTRHDNLSEVTHCFAERAPSPQHHLTKCSCILLLALWVRNKATGDYACSYAIPSNFSRMNIARTNESLWCRFNSVDV